MRGGAVIDEQCLSSPDFMARVRLAASFKHAFARQVATLIEDDDTLLFDTSSTVY